MYTYEMEAFSALLCRYLILLDSVQTRLGLCIESNTKLSESRSYVHTLYHNILYTSIDDILCSFQSLLLSSCEF